MVLLLQFVFTSLEFKFFFFYYKSRFFSYFCKNYKEHYTRLTNYIKKLNY